MSDQHKAQPCPNCQVGRIHFRSATLMTWLGNDLITVPNFPAWVCDICGHCTYDAEALAQLSILLNPEAGTPIQPRPQPPGLNPPANTQPPA